LDRSRARATGICGRCWSRRPSVPARCRQETDAKSAWVRQLKERRHVNVVSVALAAKDCGDGLEARATAAGKQMRPYGGPCRCIQSSIRYLALQYSWGLAIAAGISRRWIEAGVTGRLGGHHARLRVASARACGQRAATRVGGNVGAHPTR
jgi:hypothetical protein